jgi:hypothetical protein
MTDSAKTTEQRPRPLAEGEIDKGDGHAGPTYDPDPAAVSNARMQGIGMGQKDLVYQRDPTRADSSEHYGRTEDKDPDAGEHR